MSELKGRRKNSGEGMTRKRALARSPPWARTPSTLLVLAFYRIWGLGPKTLSNASRPMSKP